MTFNRRILIQVTLPALLIGALLLAACLFSLRSLHELQVNRSRILSNDVASLLAAEELVTRLRQLRFHSLLAVMDPAPARKTVVEADHQQFEKALEEARRAASQPEELSLLRTIENAYARYRRDIDESARKLSPHPTVAELMAWADAHPLGSVVRPCEELLELLLENTLEARTESGEQVVSQTRRALSLIALLGPLAGLAWGFGVAWGLSRSITRLSVRLRDVHAHLDQELGQVRLSAEGDLHQLDRQLETILARVREVVTRLQEREREVLRGEQLSAVGQLAAGVAHEIRNPLSSIKLLVEAALGGRGSRPPSPLTPEDLHVIHDEVERLERKIQALLDFARPTQANKEPLSLKALLEQALHLVQTRLRQQKVEVQLTGAEHPITVSVDRDQFLSVLVNLFLNALDAMPHGGKLEVTVEQNAAGEVRVQVADTGPGIDPAVAGRLFTPFTSTKPTGTGLGLSVCRRIIEDYGGRLTAANRPEGGACLTISLPSLSSEALTGASRHADHPAGG